jgi:hypothetical protein
MEVAAQYDFEGDGYHFARSPVDNEGSQAGGIAVADEGAAAAVAASDEAAVLPASIEVSAPVAD